MTMQSIDYLPFVKAYPALSRSYGEVSCIAGVRFDSGTPEWIRLYPVPFRALDSAQQFAKYQPMRLRVETHRGDRRPETRRPDRDSIELLSPAVSSSDAWQQRRRFVEPLITSSMCELQRRQALDGTSLGAIRPALVEDLIIEPRNVSQAKVESARAWAAQPSLLDGIGDAERGHQLHALELVPWTFKYRYRCADAGCGTHTQSIIDWEITAHFRQVRHHADWQRRMRDRWVDEMCADSRDTALFVGNMHQHPNSFLVLGVWWPPRRAEQLALPL